MRLLHGPCCMRLLHAPAAAAALPAVRTVMTPADTPSAADSRRWFVTDEQNTSDAPRHVQAPAAMTSANARPTFPWTYEA